MAYSVKENLPKKHVRFNSSKISDLDTQQPRPLAEIQNLKPRENVLGTTAYFLSKSDNSNNIPTSSYLTDVYFPSESVDTKINRSEKISSEIDNFKHIRDLEPSCFMPKSSDYKSVPSRPLITDSTYFPPRPIDPGVKINERDFSIPKPSDDLELSILDSSEIFSGNALNSHRYDDKYPRTIQDMRLERKMCENDTPYPFSPAKMPISRHVPSVQTELRDISPVLATTAAKSRKEFHRDKTEYGQSMGFFTLPNSAPISDTTTKDSVANAKNIFFNQKTDSETDPRCCGSRLTEKTLMPNIQSQNFNFNHRIVNKRQNTKGKENVDFQHSNGCQEERLSIRRCKERESSNFGCNKNNFDYCDGARSTISSPRFQFCKENEEQCCHSTCDCSSYHNHTKPYHCAGLAVPLQSRQNTNLQFKQLKENKIPETIEDSLEAKRRGIELKELRSKRQSDKVIESLDIEENNLVVKSKNEPTVADLYEIIKMQNQQLQILQQRVDKLLTVNESNANFSDKQGSSKKQEFITNGAMNEKNITKDGVNVNCIEHISIGVMTSFEFVMSSNYVNKRNLTSSIQNDTVEHRDECIQTPNLNRQCVEQHENHGDLIQVFDTPKNGSHQNNLARAFNSPSDRGNVNSPEDPGVCKGNVTSSNAKQCRVNFLDGIEHYSKKQDVDVIVIDKECGIESKNADRLAKNATVDGAIQTDANFPEEDCSEPNVGWTFYNKVMNRVNNILQSPPNASTEQREHRGYQKSPLPNIDKGQLALIQNQIATTKRVTLDTTPMLFPASQYPLSKPSSELSLHMRQLASKYNIPTPSPLRQQPRRDSPMLPAMAPVTTPPLLHIGGNQYQLVGDVRNELSFATMQYMQRYQLLAVGNEQTTDSAERPGNYLEQQTLPQYLKPAYKNPSRILDITALKQQPKLL